ncbi:MAG: hypothetical protein OS112_09725 [Methanoregula sp.]|nr:MAG: hypothetical protein OS112_09725 [Methanoregula sp.]
MARHFPSSRYIRIPAALMLLVILMLPVMAAETLTAGLQLQPSASCPQGCSCMPPGQAANMQYVRCSDTTNPCGYDSAKQPLYCYKPPATACPSGCECLSDTDAKAKYGSYARCSEISCAISSATTAAVIPKYCVKPAPAVTLTVRTLTLVPTPVCPSGCECMPESLAMQQPNMYVRCSDTACSQVVTGSAVINSYCYRKAVTASPAACPSGCSCMPEAKAKEAFGSYERCSETPCSAGSANTATAAAAPDYCFRAKTTPSVCTDGCDCITPDDAKLKFGFLPDRCSSEICGYYQPVTTAASPVEKYCFKRPAATPTVTSSPACPEGCTCLSKDEGIKYGFPVCKGVTTICGYDNNKNPLYCFEKVPNTKCYYDYQKNACTGTCGQPGYDCTIVYSRKDDSGKVTAAVCDCIPPATTSCTYDKDKNACTGTCSSGGQCIQVGLSQTNVAAPAPMCGCEVTTCYFDYAKDSCAGSCNAADETCQLNTMYRDPVTGKTAYAECHCKAKGEVPPLTGVTPFVITPAIPSGQPCGCSAATSDCSGDCAAGQTCFMTGTTTDASGKNICSACECKAVCQLDTTGSQCSGYCPQNGGCQMFTDQDPTTGVKKVSCGCGGTGAAPSQPAKAANVITSIGNFFKSLFGMK